MTPLMEKWIWAARFSAEATMRAGPSLPPGMSATIEVRPATDLVGHHTFGAQPHHMVVSYRVECPSSGGHAVQVDVKGTREMIPGSTTVEPTANCLEEMSICLTGPYKTMAKELWEEYARHNAVKNRYPLSIIQETQSRRA